MTLPRNRVAADRRRRVRVLQVLRARLGVGVVCHLARPQAGLKLEDVDEVDAFIGVSADEGAGGGEEEGE